MLFLCWTLFSVVSQTANWDALIEENLPAVIQQHRTFASMPNVSSDREGVKKNMEWTAKAFEEHGFKISFLEAPEIPVFLAERIVDEKAKTILYYFHIDGQAVNPENWDQEDPFVPVLKRQTAAGEWEAIPWERIETGIDPEWRIFGRAAADDKGPIIMMLTALELMEQAGVQLGYNVKIVLDPEEEAGSEALLSTLEQYRNRYAADYMIIMDGPAHYSNQPTLTFGCRGIARCDLTTYGAKLPQHSGHFGNYAPNPVFALSHLLAGMKDEQGRVVIDGFYDGVELTPEVKALLAQVPDREADFVKELMIAEPDAVGVNYQESLQYPSLNVRHIETSWKGPGLKTIIPEWATAHLDIRLVAETDGARQIELIRRHLEKQGYYVIDRDPTDEERLKYRNIVRFRQNSGMNAYRTDLDAPFARQLIGTLETTFGQRPVTIRTMGGTVPILPMIKALDIPAVIVPMVNMDNNQHNPNENLRVGNLTMGIKICLSLLGMSI